MYPGFIGIDIHPRPEVLRNQEAQYMQLDFVYSATLPWASGTAAEIVAFHIIEHLEYDEGQILLRRAYDLLKPGASMYISCPDLALFADMYLRARAGDVSAQGFLKRTYGRTGKEMWPGDTWADRFNYHFHQATHKYQYDQESLIHAAHKAGCNHIEPLPKDHFWCRRPDHEIGIIVKK